MGSGHTEVIGDTKKCSFTGMMGTNPHWSEFKGKERKGRGDKNRQIF